jgi:hypothetical protein
MADLQTLGWNDFFAGAFAPYKTEGLDVGGNYRQNSL